MIANRLVDRRFADGSVRTLNFDIDVVIFNGLARRAGEELIDDSTL